VGKRPV